MLSYYVFNLQWVYRGIIPWSVKVHLWIVVIELTKPLVIQLECAEFLIAC